MAMPSVIKKERRSRHRREGQSLGLEGDRSMSVGKPQRESSLLREASGRLLGKSVESSYCRRESPIVGDSIETG